MPFSQSTFTIATAYPLLCSYFRILCGPDVPLSKSGVSSVVGTINQLAGATNAPPAGLLLFVDAVISSAVFGSSQPVNARELKTINCRKIFLFVIDMLLCFVEWNISFWKSFFRLTMR